MARTTRAMIALLMAVGCVVVAILPAQETSRRRPSVYGGTPAEAADPAPAPQPGLLPTDAPPPPTFAPPSAGASEGKVAPAGILGRSRRAGSLSSQLQASGQAASEEYTPTPAVGPAPTTGQPTTGQAPGAGNSRYQAAEVSPPPGAIPMPLAGPRTGETKPIEAPAGSPTASEPSAESGQSRSVLKRIKTAPATPERPQVGPPPRFPVSPSQPATRTGPSSRRMPTPGESGYASRSAPAVIDTRAITEAAVTGRSPALRVDVAGPQGITVGKPASYLVTIINEGDTAAADVQLRVAVPGFVSLTEAQPSEGEAALQADATGQARLVWALPTLAGRGHQTLRLQLVAGEGQPFDVGVEWTSRPAMAKTSVVVRQPQLALSLSGPADMTFGEEKTFTLEVSNPGSGDAENVTVQLTAGEGRRQQIEVGTVPAGQQKELPVKIVASQAGELEIHAVASGDGQLSAEAAGKVIVRKAELALAVEGPQLKYAGSEAAYTITIQNAGTAPAESVQLAAALPAGCKYVGGIDGALPSGGSLKWKLATLPPGSEKTYEVRLLLAAAGENRLAVQAQASGGIAASGEAITTVEAEADLKLAVTDPAGPLPTSEQAVYQVQIMNRGSDAARRVKIVMQFSDGMEPVAFEGCEAKIVPGQVVCQPLPELAAGEQITIRVKAKAARGGTHQFRVEVTCDESETRLVSEGTTKFFAETGRPGSAGNTAKKPAAAPQGGVYQR